MPEYTYPGVYVTESPLSALTSSNGGIAAGAFFGTAARGPDTPTLIADWASYVTYFGELEDQYDLGYTVYHYFANGGRSCYVCRVTASTAVTADSLTANLLGVQWQPDGLTDATLFDVTAKSPGVWGNSLTIAALPGTVPTSADSFGTFTVVVRLGGVEVERFVDCTIDPSKSKYVESVVNSYSAFISVSNVNPAADVPDVAAGYNSVYYTMENGADGTVADSDWTAALDGLDPIIGTLIINLAGQVSTTPVSSAVTKAAARGDSFVIIDPDKSDASLADIQTTSANFSTSAPSYAAAYAPALNMVDPTRSGPAAVRVTAPGGAIAGLYVRSEVARTVAKAPAGYNSNIVGAFAPSVKLTPAQVGELYVDSIPVNSFKTVPGAGVVINGARTLDKVDPDRYINVRRTLNYLKYNLKEITSFATFEPNDERLWEKIRQTCASFLGTFWRSQGLAGNNSAEAFFIVCDESNNTEGTIANGEVRISVGVALSTPAEFVVINLSQWSGGASSATEAL